MSHAAAREAAPVLTIFDPVIDEETVVVAPLSCLHRWEAKSIGPDREIINHSFVRATVAKWQGMPESTEPGWGVDVFEGLVIAWRTIS